jgi:hypothetical protein
MLAPVFVGVFNQDFAPGRASTLADNLHFVGVHDLAVHPLSVVSLIFQHILEGQKALVIWAVPPIRGNSAVSDPVADCVGLICAGYWGGGVVFDDLLHCLCSR